MIIHVALKRFKEETPYKVKEIYQTQFDKIFNSQKEVLRMNLKEAVILLENAIILENGKYAQHIRK